MASSSLLCSHGLGQPKMIHADPWQSILDQPFAHIRAKPAFYWEFYLDTCFYIAPSSCRDFSNGSILLCPMQVELEVELQQTSFRKRYEGDLQIWYPAGVPPGSFSFHYFKTFETLVGESWLFQMSYSAGISLGLGNWKRDNNEQGLYKKISHCSDSVPLSRNKNGSGK